MKRKFEMGGVVIQQLLQKKGGQDLFNCSLNTSERGYKLGGDLIG